MCKHLLSKDIPLVQYLLQTDLKDLGVCTLFRSHPRKPNEGSMNQQSQNIPMKCSLMCDLLLWTHSSWRQFEDLIVYTSASSHCGTGTGRLTG